MTNATLRQISHALEAHIQNHEAQVYTYIETGPDETELVATADGYLRLARRLIDFVAAAG